MAPPHFVTLGMFIIDEFSYRNENGQSTGRTQSSQIGGGGTYAAIGARLWLPADQVGMIIDRGTDFPPAIQSKLQEYGPEMWLYRNQSNHGTTRALNSYMGDHRSFEYLTPRIRITPRDFTNTRFAGSATLHFICSPSRASTIIAEVREVEGWNPVTIYEPIPDRCVPEELPALTKVLSSVSILSPNAEEALSLLSLPLPPTKVRIEEAAARFLDLGVGEEGRGWVIIRSGSLGAHVASRESPGRWIDAFWASGGASRVVDVTGAGNSFLGGLSAGLLCANGDIYEATFYASISASFIVEQNGLPTISRKASGDAVVELWNDDTPLRRLEVLRSRHGKH